MNPRKYAFFVVDSSYTVLFSLSRGVTVPSRAEIEPLYDLSNTEGRVKDNFSHLDADSLQFAFRMVSNGVLLCFASPAAADETSALLVRLQTLCEMVKGPAFASHSTPTLKRTFKALADPIEAVIDQPCQLCLHTHNASIFRRLTQTDATDLTSSLTALGTDVAAVIMDGQLAAATESFMRLSSIERSLLPLVIPGSDDETPIFLPFTNPAVASRLMAVKVDSTPAAIVLAICGSTPTLPIFKGKVDSAFDCAGRRFDSPATPPEFSALLYIEGSGRALVHSPVLLDGVSAEAAHLTHLYKAAHTVYSISFGELGGGTKLVHIRRKGKMCLALTDKPRAEAVRGLMDLVKTLG